MKQSSFAPQRVVRSLALAALVLGVAFVAAPPAAEARGLPAPHEVIRDLHRVAMSHVRHVGRFVDHSVGFRNDDRRADYRRYPGRVYDHRYYRPSYRYPVVTRTYRPYRSYYNGGYVRGYVARPSVGIVVGVRPERCGYRYNDCDRNRYCDADRRYYDNDRRQYDDDYDYDYDEDGY